MLNANFVIFGAVLNLFGSVSYVISTLKGKTSPNRITWSLWALAPLIAFSAQIAKGVGIQSLMTFMVGFGPLMVLIASFVNRKSVWKLTTFDFICGGLSVVGLILWTVTKEGNVAIALAIAADTLAAIPTVVKSYKAPETENANIYLFAAISAGITLLTLDNWSFEYSGFPVYILVICAFLYALIKFKFGKKFQRDPSDILPA